IYNHFWQIIFIEINAKTALCNELCESELIKNLHHYPGIRHRVFNYFNDSHSADADDWII
ncbi:hypothetical protein, partial [Erwinia amylovora]|uniref:hypothetical protein n=1 Tax=Erwinia amylovora TaxID=552 RepID=UPI001962A3B2